MSEGTRPRNEFFELSTQMSDLQKSMLSLAELMTDLVRRQELLNTSYDRLRLAAKNCVESTIRSSGHLARARKMIDAWKLESAPNGADRIPVDKVREVENILRDANTSLDPATSSSLDPRERKNKIQQALPLLTQAIEALRQFRTEESEVLSKKLSDNKRALEISAAEIDPIIQAEAEAVKRLKEVVLPEN